MMKRWDKISYWTGVSILIPLSLLFALVLVTAIAKDCIYMWANVGWGWKTAGNYVGMVAGIMAYGVCLLLTLIPRFRNNLRWFMKFTHELTHTLVAIPFFAQIREFVVKDKECYVSYKAGRIGYVPITLSPYCIPVYTFMLFPFRFWGDGSYMIIFDALIAFTYTFHLHSFMRQTRFSQSDIQHCGTELSVAFITFVNICVLSLLVAIPKGGVMNALCRVFWEYPTYILTDFSDWKAEIIQLIL